MQSADYKERFVAEYLQTKIRSEKLRDMLVKYEAGTLNFIPFCSPHGAISPFPSSLLHKTSTSSSATNQIVAVLVS